MTSNQNIKVSKASCLQSVIQYAKIFSEKYIYRCIFELPMCLSMRRKTSLKVKSCKTEKGEKAMKSTVLFMTFCDVLSSGRNIVSHMI